MKILLTPKATIRANVVVMEADKVRYGQTHVSNIGVYADKFLLATKCISGVYSEAQGLTEFRRNPKTFKKTESYTVAAGLGLVPA